MGHDQSDNLYQEHYFQFKIKAWRYNTKRLILNLHDKRDQWEVYTVYF